jgi:hypothetical protein
MVSLNHAALHRFAGVLVEIDARPILQTCRYIDERQGAQVSVPVL